MKPFQQRNDAKDAKIDMECLKENNIREAAGVRKYNRYANFLE